MSVKFIGYIYTLTNTINGKYYVGQTINVIKRKKNYETLKCKSQRKLYYAIKKYGFENFEFKVIDEAVCKNKLDELESFYIIKYNCLENGYNLRFGGYKGKHAKSSINKIGRSGSGHSMFGKKHSLASREKMSKSHMGKIISIETRKKQSLQRKGELNINYGKSCKIFCFENNKTYISGHEAAVSLGCFRGHIYRNLKGELKSVKGESGKRYTFVYVTKD